MFGTIISTPAIFSGGKPNPASMTTISSPDSIAIILHPNSPNPPKITILIEGGSVLIIEK